MQSLRQRLSIGQKIGMGFGVVLVLLLIVSAKGIVSLNSVSDNFAEYRAMALQSNQAGRIQGNLLAMQVGVKNFIITETDDSVAVVKERGRSTLALIEEYQTMPFDDAANRTLLKSHERISEYLDAFDAVVALQEQRNDVVLTQLDVLGPKMRGIISEVMESAYDDNDPLVASRAGKVMQNLMLMRFYAKQYLLENSDKNYDRAIQEGATMAQALEYLSDALENPRHKELLEQASTVQGEYMSYLARVQEIIAKRNLIISDVLDTTGPIVAAEMEELKLDNKRAQSVVGPAMKELMENAILMMVGVGLLGIALGVTAAVVIWKGTSGPINAITGAMKTLADGDKEIEIPGANRGDEIGAMSDAVAVFKANMIRADELAAEQESERQQREKRTAKVEALTKSFDQGVTELLASVSTAANDMEDTASSMSSIADSTNERATTVATAAEQASANVQTVATATEELSASITEISRQVSQAAEIANRAVDQADTTDKQIQNLSNAAQKIGDVINLISEIAEQTNLLALNATIEAARAGESGKGFAVVASEVKSLASQTAKATDEIAAQIGAVQSETSNAVAAIQGIRQTITEISDIAGTVASAVEEQGAATREIAVNVEEAAKGAEDVSSNIIQVTAAAGEAGSAATQVTGVAGDLKGRATSLRHEVEGFLQGVRTA